MSNSKALDRLASLTSALEFLPMMMLARDCTPSQRAAGASEEETAGSGAFVVSCRAHVEKSKSLTDACDDLRFSEASFRDWP